MCLLKHVSMSKLRRANNSFLVAVGIFVQAGALCLSGISIASVKPKK